jgi:hypothetical protein
LAIWAIENFGKICLKIVDPSFEIPFQRKMLCIVVGKIRVGQHFGRFFCNKHLVTLAATPT